MRLQQPPPPPAVTAPAAGGGLIPGLPIPPELQAAGNQLLQGVGQAIPGLIPPGLIPGQQPAAQTPVQPQMPLFGQTGLGIVASMPVSNDDMKKDILDLFGKEDNYVQGTTPCPTPPGMGFTMVRQGQPNVDLLVSLSCNKAFGVNGFVWPHKNDVMNAETATKAHTIYQALFGMPAPQGS